MSICFGYVHMPHVHVPCCSRGFLHIRRPCKCYLPQTTPWLPPCSDAVTAAFSRTLLPCTTPQASLASLDPEQTAWQPKPPALHSCIIASSRRHARTHDHISPGPNDCPECSILSNLVVHSDSACNCIYVCILYCLFPNSK